MEEETDDQDDYYIKHEDPQGGYDTTCDDTDEYMYPNEKKYDQE